MVNSFDMVSIYLATMQLRCYLLSCRARVIPPKAPGDEMSTYTLLIYMPGKRPIRVIAKGRDAEAAYENYSETVNMYYAYRVYSGAKE